MARNELRPVIKLRSTAGTGHTYVRPRRALQRAVREDVMSARCQLTGTKPIFGNNVSHSHRRYWLPEAAVARIRARGEKV